MLYPKAIKIGIADEALDNWSFLEKHTDKQMLDFYHATEYLTGAAEAVFTSPILRKEWLDDRCYQLKHAPNAANLLIDKRVASLRMCFGRPPSPSTVRSELTPTTDCLSDDWTLAERFSGLVSFS